MHRNTQSKNAAADKKLPPQRHPYSTRLKSAMESNILPSSGNAENNTMDEATQMPGIKRRAEASLQYPTKLYYGIKRFALGNLTNAETDNSHAQKPHKAVNLMTKKAELGLNMKEATKTAIRAAKLQSEQQPAVAAAAVTSAKENEKNSLPKPATVTSGATQKPRTRASKTSEELAEVAAGGSAAGSIVGQKKPLMKAFEAKQKKRLSSEFEDSDNSLYVSAVDTLDEEPASSSSSLAEKFAHLAGPSAAPPPDPPALVEAGTEMEVEHDAKLLRKPSTVAPGLADPPFIKSEPTEAAAAEPPVIKSEPTEAAAAAEPPVIKSEPTEAAAAAEPPVIKSEPTEAAAAAEPPAERSPRKRTPPGIEDFDLFYWRDVYQVSEYAQDIFDYLRDRETRYVIDDYMPRQPHLTTLMRAMLVDWMVEMQESFELNHETLYLAVKIVDTYLSMVPIDREELQLVAAAALLIAAKYDERVPPTVDDFLYLCDGAYERPALLRMERTVFRVIGYDLGHPLSYRFLRRYARVNRIAMPTLTLARYILETSLMEYATVTVTDSKLACAALFIALRMYNQPGWNATLEFYSGYKLHHFMDIVVLLNNCILQRDTTLVTIRHKYSHGLFFHVAKHPKIINPAKLFENTGVQYSVIPVVSALCSSCAATSSE